MSKLTSLLIISTLIMGLSQVTAAAEEAKAQKKAMAKKEPLEFGYYDKLLICYKNARKLIYVKSPENIMVDPVISNELDGIIYGDLMAYNLEKKLFHNHVKALMKKDQAKGLKIGKTIESRMEDTKNKILLKHIKAIEMFGGVWLTRCNDTLDRIYNKYCDKSRKCLDTVVANSFEKEIKATK